MRTYRAELAPWRMRPLHPKYVDRVYAIAAQIRRQGGTRHPAYVTICPYCGTEDRLIGTIRVGAKQQVPNIPMTSTGYDVPNARGRETEILVIHCGNPECGAAIDPLAYWAPVNFYEQKEKKSLL